MKTFNDLKFGPHPHAEDLGVVASLTLDNGYAFSVVANTDGGSAFYGIHPDTFEVTVFNPKGNFVPLSVSDDMLGWQPPHQITSLMHQFELDGFALEKLLHDLRNDFNEKVVAKHAERAGL